MGGKWRCTRERLEKGTYGIRGSWRRLLVIMALMVVLSLVAIFLFAQFSAQSMEDNVRESLLQSVEQRRLNLDFQMRSIQNAAEDLMPQIYPYVTSNADRETQLREFTELNSILTAFVGREIASVRLYVPSEKIYSSQRGTFYPMDQLSEADQNRYLNHGGLTWEETHDVPLLDPANGTWVSRSVITCGYTVRHRSNYDRFACVLMLDIPVSDFDEVLFPKNSAGQRGFLVNHSGVCLAAQDQTMLGEEVVSEHVMEQIRDSGFGSLRDGGRVYLFDRLTCGGDWYVVMDCPDWALGVANSPQASAMGAIVVLVLVISLTMVFILAYNFIMSITLARVNTDLDALHTGRSAEISEEPHSPLRSLERSADRIVMTVTDLMEKRYKDQIAIAESQMKSLQAQIKPHFLYNTLDVIKWMIMDERGAEAVWMVNALSKYLRQSITKGPGVIPLSEELELSRTYLVIMDKRFSGRFAAQFEVDEEAEHCMLPKLLLQPLLENALLHGVLYCDKPEGELTVRGWVSQGQLYLEVEDNGSGMSEERRQTLEEGGSGYGLSNIRKRVMLFSHGKGEFHIFSREGIGTCVAIQLPAVTAEEMPGYEAAREFSKEENV